MPANNKIKKFLDDICENIKYKPIHKEISNEIENHILETSEHFKEKGQNEDEAIDSAIIQMGNAEEIGKQLNKVHRPKLDWKLLLIVVVLIGFGILVSFIRTNNHQDFFDAFPEESENYMMETLTSIAVGLILSLGVYFFDYTKVSKYSNILYIIATALMAYALIDAVIVGEGIRGAFFGIFISLEALTVPLYIISFVGFIANYDGNKEININRIEIKRDIVKILVLSIISIYLFNLSNIATSGIILAIIYLIIITSRLMRSENNRKKYSKYIIYGAMGILLVVFFTMILSQSPYRLNRIFSSFLPEADFYSDYSDFLEINQRQVIDSAKLIGEAENMSDAIGVFDEGGNYAFISIIAHYGWLIGIILIISIIALSLKIIYNSKMIKDIYGKYLVIGIGSFFILESVFNILMNLTFGVESNFSLPFVSYEGAELIKNMICLAIILSVYRRKNLIFTKNKIEGIECK